MENYKIETNLLNPDGPKARNNKTGINFMIFILISWKIVYNTMLFMIFQYGWEPILIQRIFIGSEAILEIIIIYQ